MSKLLLAAAAVTAALAFGGPSSAQAAPQGIHVGATIQVAGNRHHYRPRHRPVIRRVLPRRQVIRLVQRQGYRNCAGWGVHRDIYSLRCLRRGGVYTVRVNARTGQVIQSRRGR